MGIILLVILALLLLGALPTGRIAETGVTIRAEGWERSWSSFWF